VALDPRLLRRARSARAAIAASVGVGVATALLIVAQAALLAVVIAAGVRGAGVSRAALLALLGVVALRAAAAWASEVVAARCSARVKSELRLGLLARAAGLDAPAGSLATLATRGIDALDPYFARYLPQLALAAIVPVAVLIVLAAGDWVSAAIILVTLPLVPVFMALVGATTRDRMDAQVRSLQRLGGHFLDVVAGLPTLKVFGRARAQAAAIATVSDRHRAETLGTLRIAFLSSLVLELLASLSVALVAVAVGLRLLAGTLGFETALIVLILAPEAYLPLRRLGESYHAGAEGAAAARQILDALEAAPPERSGVRPPAGGPIAVEGLHVARRETVLDGLWLTVRPGEIVAITGPSGCGKSTLLHVLLGLERPSEGRVRVGATDLAELDLTAWHAGLAWVPQRPHLFASTIADNVRVGRAGAPDAAVWRALADARLADTVARLPQGLDTPLGERGAGLSAGERQRVALARAFIRDAPLLLLDEPTASLDGTTEADVIAAVRRLVRGRTVILVAHRPALIALADRVVALAPAEAAA
jgi:ATP-binding cassette subfamily C protein CydCD